MPIIRYSAIEQFGVPVENHDIRNAGAIAQLMNLYDIESSVVDSNNEDYPIDITPHYWASPLFRLFLNLVDVDNATVDLMPTKNITQFRDAFTSRPIKGPQLSYRIGPADRPSMLVGGHSPRFIGKCIHEFVLYAPKSASPDN